MSKGHCTGAYYSVLARAGYFPEADLSTYMEPLSKLNGHPNRNYLPGVETNTGPLGHGLPGPWCSPSCTTGSGRWRQCQPAR